MNVTATSTTRLELMISWRVGHATLRISPRTSERYCFGVVRSRAGCCAGARCGRAVVPADGRVGPSPPWRAIWRFVCRFTVTPRALSRLEQGRRDSNPQPPVLETGALPVELLPSGPGADGRE